MNLVQNTKAIKQASSTASKKEYFANSTYNQMLVFQTRPKLNALALDKFDFETNPSLKEYYIACSELDPNYFVDPGHMNHARK